MKVPVVAQYAFVNRKQGAFIEGGLALANLQLFTAGEEKSRHGLAMLAPVDLTFGAGYRFASVPMEVHIRADIGQYTRAWAWGPGGSASGEVASEDRALHGAIAIGFGRRF